MRGLAFILGNPFLIPLTTVGVGFVSLSTALHYLSSPLKALSICR